MMLYLFYKLFSELMIKLASFMGKIFDVLFSFFFILLQIFLKNPDTYLIRFKKLPDVEKCMGITAIL